MKQNSKIGMFIFLLSFVLTGCAINHHPNLVPKTISVEDLLDTVKINESIAIINNCQQKGDIDFCNLGLHHYWGDYYVFTDIAKEVLKDALVQMGVTIDNAAEKKIKLSVDKVSCRQGAWVCEMAVVLTAQLEDGSSFQFKGTQKFGVIYALTPAVETAIVRSIYQLLSDDEILAYLEK